MTKFTGKVEVEYLGYTTVVLDPGKPEIVVTNPVGAGRIFLDGYFESLRIKDDTGRDLTWLRGGQLELSTGSAGLRPTILLDGTNGIFVMRDGAGKDSIKLEGATGDFTLFDQDGNRSLAIIGKADWLGGITGMWIGATKGDPGPGNKAGLIAIRNSKGADAMILDGANNIVRIYDGSGKEVLGLDANAAGGGYAGLFLGGAGKPGILVMRDGASRDSISLNGLTGDMNVFDENGKRLLAVRGKVNRTDTAGLWIGAHPGDSASGAKAGYLEIRNKSGNASMILNGTNNSIAVRNEAGADTVILDGAGGDIKLQNADCAEDFDICQSELSQVEPGTVMVIDSVNTLRVSSKPYDKRVAGVVSGAGDYKPGLVLDKKQSNDCRKSISLMGKVNCKVDAETSSIEVGDLLTSSSTLGHAMKATDPLKAFGAVVGKALRPLRSGTGLIPILIALQ